MDGDEEMAREDSQTLAWAMAGDRASFTWSLLFLAATGSGVMFGEGLETNRGADRGQSRCQAC